MQERFAKPGPWGSDTEIAAREAEVLAQPQRLTPLDPLEARELALASWRKLRKAVSGSDALPADAGQVPEIYYTMLRHPGLWDAVAALSIQLIGAGQLPARDRELAVLRAGWLLRAPYEWGEHVAHAKQAGISSDEIERLTEGSAASGWNDHDRALLRAVEELHAGAMICDTTWAELSKALSETQLFELTVLVGQFTTVAYFQNALRLPLRDSNLGLRAR